MTSLSACLLYIFISPALATLKPHAVPGMAPIPGALPPGAAAQPPVPEPMEAAEGGPAGMTDEIIQKVMLRLRKLLLKKKETYIKEERQTQLSVYE